MKKQSFNPMVLISIGLLLALALVFAYYALSSKKMIQTKPSESSSPLPSPEAVVAVQPQANGELQTYVNEQFGFSFSYPKKYRATVDKTGWPKAVVILYDGGQSYNLVVEVAQSAAEYQDLNVTNGIGETIVKSEEDLFIVMRNLNSDPEISQVIESFRFVR